MARVLDNKKIAVFRKNDRKLFRIIWRRILVAIIRYIFNFSSIVTTLKLRQKYSLKYTLPQNGDRQYGN